MELRIFFFSSLCPTEDVLVVLSTTFIELITGLGRRDGEEENVLVLRYLKFD